ncbi:MAG: class I tRNA ligase family protein, partial [Acetobacteraceae bacterium]|nr:class I tRNA ligase family protein [Acetobacteraceae bacterium]
EATAALEAYRFDEYAAACYRFTWNTYCDWFIEFAKPVLAGPDGAEKAEVRGAAQHVLGVILRLLHPAVPFVTEELWDSFGYGAECSLIRAAWPEGVPVHEAEAARAELDWVVRLISEIRTARSEVNVSPKIALTLQTNIYVTDPDVDRVEALVARHAAAIKRLGGIGQIDLWRRPAHQQWVPTGSTEISVDGRKFAMQLLGHVDLEGERLRLDRDLRSALAERQRIRAKLGNADFVARAPEEVVEENRERLAAAEAEVARLEAALARIAG